jgi:hypothetical protein
VKGTVTGILFVLAAAAQEPPNVERFELAGIHMGMPIKEAMGVLRAHNANLRLSPESASYRGLPSALTYAINAVGQGEGFYLMVTMPPNEPAISKVTWVTHFGNETIPKQEVLVANLARKYGPISWDTGPAALEIGTRDVYWIDDEQGNRVKMKPQPRCLGQSTFYMNGLQPGSRIHWDPVNVRLPVSAARLRIEQGFVNREDPVAAQCSGYSMIHARLFRASVMGVRVPNLVEYLVMVMGSGPLDRKTTQATHEYWLKTAKAASSMTSK